MNDPEQSNKRPMLRPIQGVEVDGEQAAKRQRIAPHTSRATENFVSTALGFSNKRQNESVKGNTAGNSRAQAVNLDGENSLESFTPSPVPEIWSENSVAEYDTCFGMIQLSASNLHQDILGNIGQVRIEVTLKFQGRRIIICNSESMAYGGVLEHRYSEALSNLSENFELAFDAYLMLARKAKSVPRNYSLCIVLQGHRKDADQIGLLLSGAEIYLQTPRAFYKPLKVFNPQYLYRPPDVDRNMDIQKEDESDQDIIGGVILADGDALKNSIYEAIDSAVGPQNYDELMASPRLQTHLKPHQLKALSMMVEKESGRIEGNDFASMWTTICDSNGRKRQFLSGFRYRNIVTNFVQSEFPVLCLGGILADVSCTSLQEWMNTLLITFWEMGLGKTLSMLALITLKLDGMESLSSASTQLRTTIIVTPLSLLQTWEEQIKSHIYPGKISYYKYHGPSKQISLANLQNYDIVLTTYETFTIEGQKESNDNKEAMSLAGLEWYRVVLDEAHLIRNPKSKRHQTLRDIKARYRWCLTGTPIFNRVEDFGALLAFLHANPFDNPRFFHSFILIPFKNNTVRALPNLRRLVQSVSLRRRKATIQETLGIPARQNRIEEVILDNDERLKYNKLKHNWDKILQTRSDSVSDNFTVPCIFQIILRLRQFCNHSLDLLPPSALAIFSEIADEDETLNEILQASEKCAVCMKISRPQQNDSTQAYSLDCGHMVCSRCKREEDCFSLEEVDCKLCLNFVKTNNTSRNVSAAQSSRTVSDNPDSHGISYKPSSKVMALMKNLQDEKLSTSPLLKSVVFSGWKKMLDLVEKALRNSRITYERIDGSLNDEARRAALQKFRAEKGYCVLLASIGSSGVGLDLTVASRVHMLEPQWSPMAQEQALDRVHRMGQKLEVVVTRYIVKNSIEEYVVAVQGIKSTIINQSVEGDESGKVLSAKQRFMKASSKGGGYLQES